MRRDTLPQGKGWFIWQLDLTMGGNPFAIVDEAKRGGIEHLFFHIHNGSYGEIAINKCDLTPYINAAVEAGIQVWGWGAVYKDWWLQGTDRVIEAFQKHPKLSGYIMDVEGAMKNAPIESALLIQRLRLFLPDVPIGLSSYRFPSVHQDISWRVLRDGCDFDIPQVYWEKDVRPDAGAQQLQSSYDEFQRMTPKLPYVATGSAYKNDGWKPTLEQIKSFMDKAKELDLPGIDFWVWYQTKRDLPAIYSLINDYPWNDENPTPVPAPEPIVLRVKNPVNIRTEPSLWSSKILGVRQYNDRVFVKEIRVLSGTSVWARDKFGWSAIVYNGKQYMI